MREGASYIKDTTDFQDKIKNLCVLKMLFQWPHAAGLKSLKDRRIQKKISTEDLVKISELVLKITTLSLIEVF